MPAIACPQCGAPTRVSLATPDWMGCASCRYAGPPAPQVRQELLAAREVLWRGDARRRQLGWTQQRLGAGARGGPGCLLAVVVVPFASCGGFSFFASMRGDVTDVVTFVLFLGPALFALIAGLFIVREVKKTRAVVETSCVAVPPAVAGGALGCHVCGADLPQADLSRTAVVRCRYCAADNVVRTEAVSAAVAQGIRATEALMAQVQRHAVALYHLNRRSSRLLLALVLVAPIAAFITLLAITIFSPTVEPTAKYVLFETDAGPCLAELQRAADGKVTYSFGFDSPSSNRGRWIHVDDTRRPTFRAGALVGAKAHSRSRSGKVVRVERSQLLGAESAILDGQGTTPAPSDLCLDEVPDDLTAVPLP